MNFARDRKLHDFVLPNKAFVLILEEFYIAVYDLKSIGI